MNAESLWTRIKQGVLDSASVAAEKAEHLGKVGRARLDIAETRHAIRDLFAELGGILYDHIQSDGQGNVADTPEVRQLADKIRSLEAELKAREGVLESLRAEHDARDPGAMASEDSR